MKSIKEKAEEYTSDITNPVTNNAAFLAYKTGANYVLDEIVPIIKADIGSYKSQLDKIKQIVEQLKK